MLRSERQLGSLTGVDWASCNWCVERDGLSKEHLGSLPSKLLVEPIPAIMIREAWEAGNLWRSRSQSSQARTKSIQPSELNGRHRLLRVMAQETAVGD